MLKGQRHEIPWKWHYRELWADIDAGSVSPTLCWGATVTQTLCMVFLQPFIINCLHVRLSVCCLSSLNWADLWDNVFCPIGKFPPPVSASWVLKLKVYASSFSPLIQQVWGSLPWSILIHGWAFSMIVSQSGSVLLKDCYLVCFVAQLTVKFVFSAVYCYRLLSSFSLGFYF